MTVAAQEREARARAVLAQVEQRTGARSLVPAHRAPAPLGTADLERLPLPVHPALEPLLGPGLRRGSTVVVLGPTSLLLALLAAPSRAGGWLGLVGHPGLGLLAAAEAGVVLERTALVPEPGADAPAVLAALLDGMDLVLAGPRAGLTDADRRRLLARARERGSLLLSTEPWPGAHLVLSARPLGWTGAGEGEGRLRRLEVLLARGGRGAAAAPAELRLTLPLPVPESPGEVRRGEQPPALRLVG